MRLSGFPIEIAGKPTPFSAIRELALIADLEEHHPVHERQYPVHLVKIHLKAVFVEFPAPVRRWMPKLVPGANLVGRHGTSLLEERQDILGAAALRQHGKQSCQPFRKGAPIRPCLRFLESLRQLCEGGVFQRRLQRIRHHLLVRN